MIVYLDRKDKTVDAIVRATFPDFAGRRIACDIQDSVQFYGTLWDCGSRRCYAMVRLSDLAVEHIPVEQYGSWDARYRDSFTIPSGFVVVVYTQGYRESIEIISGKDNITPLLPAPLELSREDKIVLCATRSLKSSYAGISNYRFHECKGMITLENWEATKASLIGRGLLAKNGSITVNGKNAIGMVQLYELRNK